MSRTNQSLTIDSKKTPDVQRAEVPSPHLNWLTCSEAGTLAWIGGDGITKLTILLQEKEGTFSTFSDPVTSEQFAYSALLTPESKPFKNTFAHPSLGSSFYSASCENCLFFLPPISMAPVGLWQHITYLPLEEEVIWEGAEEMVSPVLHRLSGCFLDLATKNQVVEWICLFFQSLVPNHFS